MKISSIKALLIGLTAVCVLALAGCGSGSADNDTAKKVANNTTTTTTTAEIAGPETTTTTTTVETTAEPETETTTAAEQDPDMLPVDECVKRLVEEHTGSEVVMLEYVSRGRRIRGATAEGDIFTMLDNNTGIIDLYENGKLTNLNDYSMSDPVDIDDIRQYFIYYEPAE